MKCDHLLAHIQLSLGYIVFKLSELTSAENCYAELAMPKVWKNCEFKGLYFAIRDRSLVLTMRLKHIF